MRSGQEGTISLGADGFLPDDEAHPGIDFIGFNDNRWIGFNPSALEHNSICNAQKLRYARCSDEELFQDARLINVRCDRQNSHHRMDTPNSRPPHASICDGHQLVGHTVPSVSLGTRQEARRRLVFQAL